MLHQTIATTTLPEPEHLLRLREVTTICRVGSSTIYRWMDAGTFPKPLQLAPGCVRWRRSDIDRWMESLACTA